MPTTYPHPQSPSSNLFVWTLILLLSCGALLLPVQSSARYLVSASQAAADSGVIPAAGQKIKEGTAIKGKCQPAAPYPHLAFEDQTSNPSALVPPGTKHHVDSTTSEFFRLTSDGQGDSVGTTRWGIGDTIEEMKNEVYRCGTTPSPLILPAGRYRMVVSHQVFDATFSNVTGWVDPEDKPTTTQNVDFEIVESCSPVPDAALADSTDPGSCPMSANALSDAFDRNLASRKLDTPPCYLQAQQKDPKLMSYQVRLGKDRNLLPSQDWVKKHVDNGDLTAPQEGSRFMLQGAVQQVGETYRVTMRIVNIETGVVLATSKGDGHGCPDGLQQAVDAALSSLTTPVSSYAPRQ